MQDQNIVPQVSPNSTALNAEHYQSFEMAKDNDGIIGGDDIAQIRSYAAFARAQAQAVHKSIASMSELEDVTATKAEMTETAQTFAKVSVYADERIGEILRELPKAKNQHDVSSLPTGKTQAVKDAGLTPKTASQLEQLAANPEVVEAVIAKAEQDGRVVSRSQVLKAIKERDEAREEVAALERQNDELYAQKNPEPEVIEREVIPEDVQKHIESLEYDRQRYSDDYQKLRRRNEELRKKLDRAKVLLEEKGYEDNASWDISALTSATNQYLRTYGGKAWAFDQFYRVDEVTQQEFVKAITTLAAFAQNLAQMVSDTNKLEA